MPTLAQEHAPRQTADLPLEREVSSIPFIPSIRLVYNQAITFPNPFPPRRQQWLIQKVRLMTPDPVRMTDQIDTVCEGDVRMINQYRIRGEVRKGQRGEAWLCGDTRDNDKQVVRILPPVAFKLILF